MLLKITGITLAMAAVVTAMTLSACGSGASPAQTAAQVLAADGYSHSTSFDAKLAPEMAATGSEVTGYAVGTSPAGVEAVAIVSPADTAQVQAMLPSLTLPPGETMTLNGNVLRVIAPY